jgi:hypothetical protein
LAFHSPRIGQNIPRWRTTLVHKQWRVFEALHCPTKTKRNLKN